MQRFVWDPDKARVNLCKHRIRFETAARVFTDPGALMRQDRIEDGEYRWQTVGMIDGITVMVVAHTLEEDPDGGGSNPYYFGTTR